MNPDRSPGSTTDAAGPSGLAEFGRLSARAADLLRPIARPRRWRDGAVVLRGGDVPDAALLIVSGRLRLSGTSAAGEEVLFRWFEPNEFVGLASVVGDLPFAVDAVANGDCETLHFERLRLLALLREDAEAALLIARLISRYAWDVTHLVIAQTGQGLTARVLSVLNRLADHSSVAQGHAEGRMLKISQGDIASAVGASRQRVNIELHKLEAMGRIRLGYRHLVLLERAPGG